MNIVIIEDEQILAEDLAGMLKEIDYEISVSAVIGSVKEGVLYFQVNLPPDLIFSDIQLGDGLSFEIFKAIRVQAPVIFCTAYNEYALEAIRNNGIDYILKPFTAETIFNAIRKYVQFKKHFVPAELDYDRLISSILGKEPDKRKISSVLVYYKDKIMPISLDEIALFYIDGELTRLHMFSGKTFIVSQALDELEELSGGNFFRVNRQYLVSRRAVADANYYLPRKYILNLSIVFKETIVVSKNKTSSFLSWLTKK